MSESKNRILIRCETTLNLCSLDFPDKLWPYYMIEKPQCVENQIETVQMC